MKGRLALLLTLLLFSTARAQFLAAPDALALDGQGAKPDELSAWALAQEGQHVRARELAQKIIAADARSFVAHLVLGHVQHYAEANLPRALFHLNASLRLFERRHGDRPGPAEPWRWHASLLRSLASTHGDMEHHSDKLAYIARYNDLYDPDMIAERAWPLMKLGRYREARIASEVGLASERAAERTIALNALCAIEFEAGNDGQSYDACKRAVDDGYATTGAVSAVDLTNFAEASRSLFKLDEAERIALTATTALPSWYGNPWTELAELYVRQGRFAEALASLKQVPEYRLKRPPHVRDADRNELRRVLASFLLMLAKPEAAQEVTGRAIASPERRAHNSRDPAQDGSVLSLLDRRARRVGAELLFEEAATKPWYMRPMLWGKALWLRLEGRRSAARVQRLLEDDARLVGSFRLGTASAAIMPPWLTGELVEVLGAGVTETALKRARRGDNRPGSSAYYDATAAEAAWAAGHADKALARAERALGALGPSEVLLQARVMAIAADAARLLNRLDVARKRYDAAFQRDPGVFRRLEIPIAVEIKASAANSAKDAAAMLARSPRFTQVQGGLQLSVRADRAEAQVCLSGEHAQRISCADIKAKSAEPTAAYSARIAREAMEQLFAPKIDLTQMDIHSLDGQNLRSRNALKTIFE